MLNRLCMVGFKYFFAVNSCPQWYINLDNKVFGSYKAKAEIVSFLVNRYLSWIFPWGVDFVCRFSVSLFLAGECEPLTRLGVKIDFWKEMQWEKHGCRANSGDLVVIKKELSGNESVSELYLLLQVYIHSPPVSSEMSLSRIYPA